MNIYYYSGYVNWWGTYGPNVLKDDKAGQIGGGETCMLRTAFELAARGHAVTLFYSGRETSYNGVLFKRASSFFRAVVEAPPDCAVSWADAAVLAYADPTRTKRVVAQQLNDMTGGDSTYGSVDAIVSPSFSHLEFMRRLGWQKAGYVCHNGCDPTLYADAPALSQRGQVVATWSSPDRGLHHLLHAWPLIKRRAPGARLRIFYEIDRLLAHAQIAANEIGFRLRLIEMLKAAVDDSVEFVGAVSRQRMIEEQKRTRVMCYPCDPIGYTEGFGQAVLEAMAAGCVTIIGASDAFPSLFSRGAVMLDPEDLHVSNDTLVDAVVTALQLEHDPLSAEKQLIVQRHTWESSGAEMEAALCSILA